jgi:hypothetical protein
MHYHVALVDTVALLLKIAEECTSLSVRGECVLALQLLHRSSMCATRLTDLAWDDGGQAPTNDGGGGGEHSVVFAKNDTSDSSSPEDEMTVADVRSKNDETNSRSSRSSSCTKVNLICCIDAQRTKIDAKDREAPIVPPKARSRSVGGAHVPSAPAVGGIRRQRTFATFSQSKRSKHPSGDK